MTFPGMSRPGFRVYFAPEVHDQILRYAAENDSVEVGGVLVGNWHHDAFGPFVAVTQSICCDAATSKSGEVTFTHEAWNAIHREMDTRYSDLRIVGWYHTHPTFGIFLSERDTFIHEHFFSNPGQIAYVVDPVAETEGVFAWRKGKPALLSHYWVGEQIYSAKDKPQRRVPPAGPDEPGPAPGAGDDPGNMVSAPMLARLAVIGLAIFAIGYLAAAWRNSWEQRMIVEGAVAHYGVWKGLRPGLREELQKADAGLDQIARALELLGKEHVALAGEAAEKREAWSSVRGTLQETRELLAQASRRYVLSDEESREVARLIAARQAQLYGLPDSTADSGSGADKKQPSGKAGSADQGDLPGKSR